MKKIILIFFVSSVFMFSSCTFFGDLFFNAITSVAPLNLSLSTGMTNVALESVSPEYSLEAFENFRKRLSFEFPVEVTNFMNAYVYLASGVDEESETYLYVEEYIYFLMSFYTKSTVIKADVVTLPALSEERGAYIFGTKPSFVSKIILTSFLWKVDNLIFEGMSDTASWPVLWIAEKPYFIAILESEFPVSMDEIPGIYPYPLFFF